MGFGDTAKEALKTAVEAVQKIAKTEARIDVMFSRWESFETKIEGRLDRRLNDFEARLRELESRMAKLEGAVQGAMSQAVGLMLKDVDTLRAMYVQPKADGGDDGKALPKGDGTSI